jgi:hypothetical protein
LETGKSNITLPTSSKGLLALSSWGKERAGKSKRRGNSSFYKESPESPAMVTESCNDHINLLMKPARL